MSETAPDPKSPRPTVLCPDCTAAERDPLHAIFRGELCCIARSVVACRPRAQRAAVAQLVKRAHTPDEWAVILERIRELQAKESAA